MATVTVPELRRLAKLYRSSVDGAAERLADIIAEENDELPDLLGFPRPNLTRLLAAENAVELLVATIEGAPRVARDMKLRVLRAEARELGVLLAESAEHREDGTIALPLPVLDSLVTTWPGKGFLVLGERGSVDLGRLRALLRECRGLTSTAVVITELALVVAYTAPGARGLVRFVLQPIVHHVDAVVVPLAAPVHVGEPAVVEAIVVPTTSPSCAAPAPMLATSIASEPADLDPLPELPPPGGPRPPSRPWAARFFEVLTHAIGGVP